ncbi:MAG: alpha/beta hydrolase [Xanthomonadaceae bacterium]|nr:alpha/beta hydrolase [Xanthomonadaceae bacterium]
MGTILVRMVSIGQSVAHVPQRGCAVPARPWHVDGEQGVALAGERHVAPAAAQALLLAHGFGQTRQAWGRTAARLGAAGFDSTAFDARGHGQSGRNPAGVAYCVEQFIADQACVAQSLPAHPVLIGASMGGLIGLLGQAQRPLYSAMVLVDIAPRWRPEGMERILEFMAAHPDGFDDYAHAADAIAARLPHRPRKTQEQLASLLVPCRQGRLHWHWDPRLLDDIARNGDRLQDALLEAAAQVDIPLLLISGGQSELIDNDHIAEFLHLAPHAEHIQLANATHMLAGDDNDRFTDTVLYFLSRLPASESRLPPSSTGDSP